MSTNATCDAGLRWIEQGIAVIPIGYRSKMPDANALRWTGHYDPNGSQWTPFQDSLTTAQQLRTWTAGPRINLAVVTGWQGLVVLDFDSCYAWELYQSWAREEPYASLVAEVTYRVATGRGMHMYVCIDEPVRNGHVGVIDIKSAGGYVLTPPSVHPTGRTYTAVDPDAPIVRVERLRDIFPLQLDAPALSSTGRLPRLTERSASDDPFVVAESTQVGHLIERVKLAYRIEDWFTNLTSTGRGWFLAHCPLHDDSSPSFWIDTNRQLCGCYAGCTTRPMDVINLYARSRGLTNDQALKELAVRMV